MHQQKKKNTCKCFCGTGERETIRRKIWALTRWEHPSMEEDPDLNAGTEDDSLWQNTTFLDGRLEDWLLWTHDV